MTDEEAPVAAASEVTSRAQAARTIADHVDLTPDAAEAYAQLLAHGTGEMPPELESELAIAGLAGRVDGAIVALPVSQAYRRARSRAKARNSELREAVADFQAHYADRFDHMAGVTVLAAGDPTSAFVGSLVSGATSELQALERGHFHRGFLAERASDLVGRLRTRGVRVRSVVRAAAMADAEIMSRAAAATDAGAEVRQHPDMPLSMLVIDGARAVIDLSEPDQSGVEPDADVHARDGADMTILYTEAPEMVAVLERTFASFWSDSIALDHTDRGALGLEEEQVIALLLEGLTDGAIAGLLGVSPKTVSRRVAVLMEEFRVHTRLQLGAELARRGLC